MPYHVSVEITLRTSILDPQGKATQHALDQLGFTGIEDVRIGKFVELTIDADSAEAARERATEACRKLLANEVMEDFTVRVEEAQTA
ncbi:MAG: phosphoribosylformylglycinamidine synthase subunit PurS [Rhodothermales bacterium]|nr:phosphoribosylformylglycinamidine synthase subunit PurS [Rhodothermales bacterium]MBO6780217.1 phosphoribosylformylglycinamidine synthase subunit PurS [Rhodothermales bacterium]